MNRDFSKFKLYDIDILQLLYGVPTEDLFAKHNDSHHKPFDLLQKPALIYAIYRRNYVGAYKILNALTEPLSSQDAMAACLCSLTASKRLLNTVLDHCPPIPDFQFHVVGAVASLLNVAAECDLPQALEILLNRGASLDPGPDGISPVETAFCNDFFLSLRCLLKHANSPVTLTERMLYHLGKLRTNHNQSDEADDLLYYFSCQELLHHLMETPPLLRPLPLLSQIQMKHALLENNLELAERICKERPLSAEELQMIPGYLNLRLCTDRIFSPLIPELRPDPLEPPLAEWVSFLPCLLEHYPQLLELPEVRTGVASLALITSEPEPALQYWVDRMTDGPILIMPPSFPSDIAKHVFPPMTYLAFPAGFLPRWDERLGRRLIPAMRWGNNFPWYRSDLASFAPLLERIILLEKPDNTDQLSSTTTAILQGMPVELLPKLMDSAHLLLNESPAVLLNFCQQLPPVRRNATLPYIRKETAYDL